MRMPPHKHVLLVEADADLSSAVTAVLEDEGYRVTRVFSGEAGLKALTKLERPCFVLLDFVTGGSTSLPQLMDAAARDALPVVCMRTDERREMPPGARAVLGKPFTIKQLLSVVEANCSE